MCLLSSCFSLTALCLAFYYFNHNNKGYDQQIDKNINAVGTNSHNASFFNANSRVIDGRQQYNNNAGMTRGNDHSSGLAVDDDDDSIELLGFDPENDFGTIELTPID